MPSRQHIDIVVANMANISLRRLRSSSFFSAFSVADLGGAAENSSIPTSAGIIPPWWSGNFRAKEVIIGVRRPSHTALEKTSPSLHCANRCERSCNMTATIVPPPPETAIKFTLRISRITAAPTSTHAIAIGEIAAYSIIPKAVGNPIGITIPAAMIADPCPRPLRRPQTLHSLDMC